MKIITLEEHFESHKLNDEMAKIPSNNQAPINMSPAMLKHLQKTLPSDAEMQDVTGARVKWMNRHHINMQILSYGNKNPQNLNPEYSVKLAKLANNELAKAVKSAPNRFAALATLPVGDPKAAAKELDRAVKKLGFKGVLLKGNFDNKFFDNEFFWPIFAKAAELDVPVYFHPSFIDNQTIREHYLAMVIGPISSLVNLLLLVTAGTWTLEFKLSE